MTTLPLSPTTVFSLSQTLISIPRYLKDVTLGDKDYYYERVHIDVLLYIAEPSKQALTTALTIVSHAAEAMRSHRDNLPSGEEYSAAHNALFKYFILKRDLEMADKVHDLEKSEEGPTLEDKYAKVCAELEQWKDNFESVNMASARRLDEKIELQKEIDRLREENEALIERNAR